MLPLLQNRWLDSFYAKSSWYLEAKLANFTNKLEEKKQSYYFGAQLYRLCGYGKTQCGVLTSVRQEHTWSTISDENFIM